MKAQLERYIAKACLSVSVISIILGMSNVAQAACITTIKNGVQQTQCVSQQYGNNSPAGSDVKSSYNFGSIDPLLSRQISLPSMPSSSYSFLNMSSLFSWAKR